MRASIAGFILSVLLVVAATTLLGQVAGTIVSLAIGLVVSILIYKRKT